VAFLKRWTVLSGFWGSKYPPAHLKGMVRSEVELEAWLDEVRQAVKAKLPNGPVQF